jgi:seryl-tRNA synthetase
VIDVRELRDDPDRARASQRARGEDPALVDQVLDADDARRAAISAFEALRAQQKRLGRDVAQATPERRPQLLEAAKTLAAEVKAADAEVGTAEHRLRRAALALSNLVDPAAPVGGEDDFTVMTTVGTPRDFAAEGFTPRDHVELGALLGAIDMERAAKVSGARFAYLTGVGALLELALLQLAMTQAVEQGFTPMIPPALVRQPAMEGTGFLGQAAENVFRLEADDYYLVGTSEVPLVAYHADEILDADSLPRRYVAFSPCFRREAGTHGKDTRGIIRVHQFDKVEMVSFTTLEESVTEHQRLLDLERAFFDALGLPYRVIDTATGDLGTSAARKFDIEAWIPTQGRYREVTSTSNCTQFQARRLGIRTRSGDGGPTVPVATLNGTLVAIPRTIVAILEHYQQADGSVVVPDVLQPHLGGRTRLEPVGARGGAVPAVGVGAGE